MRIVIDTNVLIDGDTDDLSYANKIIDEVIGGNIEAFANHGTFKENQLIAGQILGNREYAAKIDQYLDVVKLVNPVTIEVVIEDDEDRKILASAVAAEADYLVTSDRHLLTIDEYEGVQIVTPGSFWSIYREQVLGESDWDKFKRDFLGFDV